jgi:hypothetical protein
LDHESHAELRAGERSALFSLMLFAGTAEGVRRATRKAENAGWYRLLMRKILLRNRFVLDRYAPRIL